MLQGRMSDTNRNLTAKTLLLLGELAKAMGPAFENVARPLMSVSVANLSDNKSQVCILRNACVTTSMLQVTKAACIAADADISWLQIPCAMYGTNKQQSLCFIVKFHWSHTSHEAQYLPVCRTAVCTLS